MTSTTTARPGAHRRPAFARWLGDTNDVTRTFLAAGRVPDMINVAGGLPEPSVYPAAELAEYAARAIAEHGDDALGYTPIEGLPALRDRIAARFADDGLHLTRDNVLVTTGGMQGLDLIGKALLDEGAPIAAQSPTYLGALDAWRPRRPEYRPFFPDRPDFDPVAALAGARFAYTVPNFSNPTGKLIGLPERRSMVAAAQRIGTWLVEDDPYGTLHYDAEPLPRMLGLSGAGTVEPYDGPVIYPSPYTHLLAPLP